jgi:F0F1-type ATP synthase membrane subunit a
MLIAFMFFLVVRQSSEEGVVEKTQMVTEMVTDLVTQEVTREPAQTQPEGQTAP